MTSAGDGFSWPFQDPQWASKILVQGLITLIPIVGWIATTGWLVLTIDNYRTGRRELPPYGFHLERGIVLFVVYVVYVIVFGIPGGIIESAGVNSDSGGLQALGNLVGFVLSVLLAFLAPSIILHTYRSGFSGGFDVPGIWQMATANMTNTIIAGLLIWVASLIGGLGIVICCVGLIFTLPYSAAIVAGIVTWYEHITSGPATAGPATAPPQSPPPPPPAPLPS
ncbi:MAG: DUF4013 domain-containing protein [Chloroflexi bacterium]|nr:MAG: DUF4013 domain-containing protein [Chloroflexota bacterium]TMF94750.1 MAG: DUF4013 domain-containing protein [Chloroflexota bacterium]